MSDIIPRSILRKCPYCKAQRYLNLRFTGDTKKCDNCGQTISDTRIGFFECCSGCGYVITVDAWKRGFQK